MPETGPRWLRLVDEDAPDAAADGPLPGEAGRRRLAALRGQLRNQLAALREAPVSAEVRATPEGAEAAAALERLTVEVTRLAEGWDRLAAAVAALSAGDGRAPEE
ncbi:hypothetical protein [Methylobacterium platani]|uniref:ABC transporter Uup C-terminal domain-containing protein n=2 Tax=Methylobacterium platani TaxID=427683 RepID=A0A179S582_9HYPH|nr:hypothetical protein [Methylobacterium platani]KMO14512.1 hypothetical protein SQ03_19550 [Methylobacterium platani JCM 14648]OAS22247.1 hypothetical protein A5481_19985 [Methylobacterium platani]